MSATSPYLMQPAKPRPDLLPGDVIASASGYSYTVTVVRWIKGRWHYRLALKPDARVPS